MPVIRTKRVKRIENKDYLLVDGPGAEPEPVDPPEVARTQYGVLVSNPGDFAGLTVSRNQTHIIVSEV